MSRARAADAAAATRTPPGGRAVLAGTVGNVVEWYDWAVYGASATVLAQVLAPGGDDGLTAVFVGFALSFLVRPAGALLVGRRVDRLGRRGALAIVLLVMTLATVAIGLLPPYAEIGAAAAVLLLLLRAAQAFAAGGELSASIPYVVEHAPPGQRGRWGGVHLGTLALGLGMGIGVVAVVHRTVDAQDLEAWGWRLPFLVALPLGLVSLYVRVRTPETAAFLQVRKVPAPALRAVLRAHGPVLRGAFVLTATLSCAFNLWFVFLPTQLVTAGRFELGPALGGTLVGVAVIGVAAPLLGALSDRVGRRPVLLVGAVLVLVGWAFGHPLATEGSWLVLLLTSALMGLALAHFVVPAALIDRLPVEVRGVGVGVAVGAASGVVGGTAPLLGVLLTRAGLDALVPAYGAAWAVLAIAVVRRWPARPAASVPG